MTQLITIGPSGDPTGKADREAISESLASAGPGGVVSLLPGQWRTDQALSIASDGTGLAGYGGGINGRTSRLGGRTVLSPAPGFAGGEVIGIPDGVTGPAITGIAIRGDASTPPDVDGIACHGNVNALEVERVSVAQLPGHGIAWFQAGGADGGACKLDKVMVQQVGKNGVHRWPSDGTLINVHTQYTGTISGTYTEPLPPGTGHGFFSSPGSGGNSALIGCRADLAAACGAVADHNGAFGDAMRFIGFGTERNRGDGILVTNSSPSGSDYRVPVIISGCSLEGDGADGRDAAAVRVQGRNQVYIDNTVSAVNTLDCAAGAPRTALWLQQAGTDAAVAEVASWASGRMSYATRGEGIRNHSLARAVKIGTTVVQVPGYQGSAVAERCGFVTTSGRRATVSSLWAYPNSGITLTALNPVSPGQVYVTDRRTGQFDIATGSADCTVFWQITN